MVLDSQRAQKHDTGMSELDNLLDHHRLTNEIQDTSPTSDPLL